MIHRIEFPVIYTGSSVQGGHRFGWKKIQELFKDLQVPSFTRPIPIAIFTVILDVSGIVWKKLYHGNYNFEQLKFKNFQVPKFQSSKTFKTWLSRTLQSAAQKVRFQLSFFTATPTRSSPDSRA